MCDNPPSLGNTSPVVTVGIAPPPMPPNKAHCSLQRIRSGPPVLDHVSSAALESRPQPSVPPNTTTASHQPVHPIPISSAGAYGYDLQPVMAAFSKSALNTAVPAMVTEMTPPIIAYSKAHPETIQVVTPTPPADSDAIYDDLSVLEGELHKLVMCHRCMRMWGPIPVSTPSEECPYCIRVRMISDA